MPEVYRRRLEVSMNRDYLLYAMEGVDAELFRKDCREAGLE
jgi:hypothetical protein